MAALQRIPTTTKPRPSGSLGPARDTASTSCLTRPTGRAFWTLLLDQSPKLGAPIEWIGEHGEAVRGAWLGERWARADGERNHYQPALWRAL